MAQLPARSRDPNYYPERTSKQPITWRCRNPDCREGDGWFEFEGDEPRCPKCTNNGHPYVVMLALIHLLVPDPAGKIRGRRTRYRMLCDAERSHIATFANNEQATDDPTMVTCAGCKTALTKLTGLVNTSGEPLRVPPAPAKGGSVTTSVPPPANPVEGSES